MPRRRALPPSAFRMHLPIGRAGVKQTPPRRARAHSGCHFPGSADSLGTHRCGLENQNCGQDRLGINGPGNWTGHANPNLQLDVFLSSSVAHSGLSNMAVSILYVPYRNCTGGVPCKLLGFGAGFWAAGPVPKAWKRPCDASGPNLEAWRPFSTHFGPFW